ncbi:MAG: flagellar basal body rod protein FlgC [Pseudomonadales bacterium]
MALGAIYDIAGSGMTAQSLRMNTTASNIANAQVVAGSAADVYKARHPIFQAVFREQQDKAGFSIGQQDKSSAAVNVVGVYEDPTDGIARYQPGHPLADENGYVYTPNVNVVEEMTNMISASRSFQINVEVMNSAKTMMQRLLTLGQ